MIDASDEADGDGIDNGRVGEKEREGEQGFPENDDSSSFLPI